jgi:hypothetical protein
MAKLKRTYAKKEEIPAEAAGLYVESGGQHVLQHDLEVEGFVPNATLEEFRNTNINLRKDLDRFEGVDPDKYKELSSREQQIRDAETKGSERIEERVKERTQAALQQWDKDRERLTGQVSTLSSKLQKAVIESRALELATPFGLRKDAARNLILIVNEQWTLDEGGEPVSFESDGKTVRLDGSGKPMRGTDGLQRFIERQAREDAKFLFEGNQGGGGQGSGAGGSYNDDGEINPWDPKTYNRTKQGEMVNKNFDKAKRMAARHGVDLKPSSIRTAA